MKIIEMVIDAYREIADTYNIPIGRIDDDTDIFGAQGYLDSLGLVAFLANLEMRLSENGVKITLASEKAMSRKQSPFLTVRTLADFIEEQIK